MYPNVLWDFFRGTGTPFWLTFVSFKSTGHEVGIPATRCFEQQANTVTGCTIPEKHYAIILELRTYRLMSDYEVTLVHDNSM